LIPGDLATAVLAFAVLFLFAFVFVAGVPFFEEEEVVADGRRDGVPPPGRSSRASSSAGLGRGGWRERGTDRVESIRSACRKGFRRARFILFYLLGAEGGRRAGMEVLRNPIQVF
jgi:hypothetical protein